MRVCVRACCDTMSEIVFRLFYIYILLLVNVVISKMLHKSNAFLQFIKLLF